MGKVVKAVVGIVATVVGVVTGQWWLVAAGVALTMTSVIGPPKPTTNAATEQRLSKKLEPETFRKIVFGETAAGADLRYWEVFGTDANRYVEVLAAATHKVHSFGTLYINEAVASYDHMSRFTYVEGASGAGTARGGHGKWTVSSAMTGCAYYVLDYTYKQEWFPQGISSRYTQVIQGALLYDPRRDIRFGGTHNINDQSTWQYSPLDSNDVPIGRNNALQMLWYQIGWRINGKLVAGKGVDVNDIDIDSFIQAANDCELMGWYSDCILSTGDNHDTNEGILEAASQGKILDTGGRFSYYVAVDDTANIAVAFESGDIVGEGFDWQPRDSMSNFFNEVAGTFVDPEALYQPRPFPMVFDAAYYTADGKKERDTVALAAVQSAAQAQKLMRIKLNRSRFQGEFSATFSYKAMRAQNYSIVTLAVPELGWTTPRLFRVLSYGISAMGGIDLTLREESASIYAAGTVTTLPAPSTGVGTNPFIGLSAGVVTATGITETGGAGSIIDGIKLNYAAFPPLTARAELKYRKDGDSDWSDLPIDKDSTETVIKPLQPATAYEFSLRLLSVYGIPGPPSTVTGTTGSSTSATSESRLRMINQLLDEALARFERDMSEEVRRQAMASDNQQITNRIGVVNPVTGDVDLRDTAHRMLVGQSTMQNMVDRTDEGLADGGYIRQPVPRDVSVLSGIYNEQIEITPEGELVINNVDGPVTGGQVLRVQEATGFLGHDAFIRRSAIDNNQGGRQFFQKPLINTTLTGDLAFDVYQSTMRWFDATTLYGVTLPFSAFQPSIGGRIVVSTAAGIVTGDLGSTTALRAPGARIGNDPGDGYLTLVEGDATYSGRMEFFNAAGARLGFVGLGTNTTLIMSAETGVTWAFDKRVDMLAGAAVTGALTVSGLATLSGGAAVTGNITASAEIHAGSFLRVRNGSGGYIQHNPGDATYTGFTEFYNAAGTRLGYMGYGSGSTLVMAAEGSVTWAFDKQLRMLAGAAITGDASVSGSFGIGTASPGGALDVRHANGVAAAVQIGGSGTGTFLSLHGSASSGGLLSIHGNYFSAEGDLVLGTWTHRDNQLYLKKDGNVGIGTASPGAKLDVVGGNNDGLQYRTSTRTVGIGMVSSENAIYWGSGTRLDFTSGGGIPLSISAGGNVGINTTSPAYPLDVNGLTRVRGYLIGTTAGLASAYRFTNDGGDSFVNAQGGKFGIGTDTPAERLHVDGRVMVTGSGYTTNAVGGVFGFYSSMVPQAYIQAPNGGEVVMWNAATAQVAVFTDNRRFGLGVSAPTAKAHIDDQGANIPGLLIHKTLGGSPGIRLTTSFSGGSTVDLESSVPGISNGGFAITVDTVRRMAFLPGGDNYLNVASGRVHHFSTNGVDFGYIADNSGTGGIYLAAEGGTNENIRLVPKGTGYVWVTGGLLVGGAITRAAADHTFAVDSGQGFHFSVGGSDVALLEASGRLSLNHITMGGLGLGEWTTWSPTPTAESGTATGLASVYAEVERHGKSVTVNFAVSQTAIGTGAAAILVPLPYAAKASRNYFGSGKNMNTGSDLRVEATGANLRVTDNNSYPMGSGAESLAGSITYQCA